MRNWMTGTALAAAFLATVASAETLTVTVEGTRSASGTVRAGLYDATGKRVAAKMVAAAVGDVVLRFEGVAGGTYAVKVFHDENGDGDLNTGIFGIPTEGYGFSNRASGRFGPPAFERMRVTVGAAPTATAATLQY